MWRRDVGPSSPAASCDSSSEECRELCRGLQCQINREREAAIAGPSQSLLASLGGGTDLTDPLPAALRRASITLVTLPSRAIYPGSLPGIHRGLAVAAIEAASSSKLRGRQCSNFFTFLCTNVKFQSFLGCSYPNWVVTTPVSRTC